MRATIRILAFHLSGALLASATGCGGGPPVEAASVPSTIEVRVSAGSPVVGATVTVYAISDATGQVNNSAGAGGVLASAGPTDALGKAVLTVRAYSGPIQIVAGGPSVSYADPTAPTDSNGVGSAVQVPASFLFTSYVAKFKPGVPVPLTFFTTLADHAALAYARGLHSTRPAKSTISEALAARDPLFVTHITNAPAAWDPTSLRWTTPAPLTRGPQSLVDSAFAAIFDVALNQLARDTAVKAGYSGGTGSLTAPTLMQLLEDDIDADGRLDGLTFGGRTVATGGATPVVMDAQFLRRPLAIALAGWSRNAAVNKSGISDADLASALVFKTINEDSSDLFGSAPTLPFDPLDHTPPELSLSASPPAYSNLVNVRLAVTARDSSGTKVVYAQVGATRRAALLVGDTWQVDVTLAAVGHNAITIWAEDLAEPTANSGLGGGAPYQLDLDVVFDPDAPRAVYDSAFASYSDERSLVVHTGTDGFALVPPSYGSGSRVTVANGGEIFKAATRLAAGGPLDAAELESTNAANIPLLRFSVPFNDKVDAPITKAEYTVVVTCPGCGTIPPVQGKLLASSSPGVAALLFDLPLSSETVPALASAIGPLSLGVSLQLADAAGNALTVGGFSFTFHVVGPPVAVTEDTAYPGYGDPRSTFPYRVRGLVYGADSYATLFDPTAPVFYGGQVRLARFLVTNPSPDPVAIRVDFSQSSSGSWKVTETWGRQSWVDQPAQVPRDGPFNSTERVIDGFSFRQSTYWATPYGSGGYPLNGLTEIGPHPCGDNATGAPAHRIGDSTNRWTCLRVAAWAASTTAVFAGGAVAPAVFRRPQQGGGETLTPDTDATGTSFIVPGAVGAAPGAIVIYVTRPTSASRIRPLTMNLIGTGNFYETYDYEALLFQETWTLVLSRPYVYDTYGLYKTGEYLAGAAESLEGALNVTSQGLVGTKLIGEPGTPGTINLSRTISNH